MDYKKFIPNQETRIKILGMLDFIPDKIMVRLQYLIKFGRKPDLMNPKRYTEKLQWYKLYYRDPLMTKCSDKFMVREYIKLKGYEHILIPIYGVYEKAQEINFDELPNQLVFKTTNGSHTNYFITVKSKIDHKKTRKILHKWLTKRTIKAGREWPYYDITPRIIAEMYLEDDNGDSLVDYKFMCFGGMVAYIFVNQERFSDKAMKFGIYDRNFQLLPYKRKGLRATDSSISKPLNFERMVNIAEALSDPFPHVRVDLYNIAGKIFFGEMTFFHGSGYIEFDPDEFDFILGEFFTLPKPRF